MQTFPLHFMSTPIHPLPSGLHSGPGCGSCRSRHRCLPDGMADEQVSELDEAITRVRLRRGAGLFSEGQPFEYLYAVHSGSFKSFHLLAGGRQQVTGFAFAGDLLALDGLATATHPGNAVALEDSEVCAIRFADVSRLAQSLDGAGAILNRLLAATIVREQHAMLVLGSMSSDERVAAFLLDIADQMKARGFSGSEFRLRMTRADIGNYLGVTLETVSRSLSAFHEERLIEVQGKRIRILDRPTLQARGDPRFA